MRYVHNLFIQKFVLHLSASYLCCIKFFFNHINYINIMRNFNLQAPAGQGLGGANLVEMKKEEMREIDGGILRAVLFFALRHLALTANAPMRDECGQYTAGAPCT